MFKNLRNKYKSSRLASINKYINPVELLKARPAKPAGATAENAAAEQVPTVKKQKLREKFVAYVKLVANDYRQVSIDIVKESDKKPFKALAYGLAFTFAGILYKTNPTFLDYQDDRKLYMNELIMCDSIRNRKSQWYLDQLNQLDNFDRLEYRSYVLFSLILNTGANDGVAVYERNCEQLNNPGKFNVFNYYHKFIRFLSKIVDIGYLRQWHYLEKNFIDYDVNEEDWQGDKSKENELKL